MKDVLHLAGELIATPSMNPMGRVPNGKGFFETRMTTCLGAIFRELDVSFVRQPVSPQRENIIAWIPGTPGAEVLLFEAHQDTVPADHMKIEPFTPKVENDRLYGRGACDVKGPMAAMLSAFAQVAVERPEPRATLVIACVVDEEHEFTGVTHFLRATMGTEPTPWPRPTCAVVAEPTDLAVVVAHKGVVRWRIETKGTACHSAAPTRGVNAIYRMGKVVLAIERLAEQLRSGPSDPLVGPASLNVGRIAGGISVNTVADRCTIEIDRRLIPGEDPTRAFKELERFLMAQPEISFPVFCEPPWMKSSPLSPDKNRSLSQVLAAVVKAAGYDVAVIGVPFGTDASKISAAGIPSVVFGPGSIAQAHAADEWISVQQLRDSVAMYERLVRLLAERRN